MKLSESSAIASVTNRLEQPPSHAESENIEEIATPQATLEDPSTIRTCRYIFFSSFDKSLTVDDRWHS